MIGIGLNEWAKGVPTALSNYCQRQGIAHTLIDFTKLGAVDAASITHLSPALLYLKPEAFDLYRELERRGVRSLNSVDSIEIADDKAATYLALHNAKVPQIETNIIELNAKAMKMHFIDSQTPVVFKRRYGGQGRWVRRADHEGQIEEIYKEFIGEGPGPIIAQPLVAEAEGKSIRVIVIDNEVVASSLRISTVDWRSNISLGSNQIPYPLSSEEVAISLQAMNAIGLGFGGVDLIPTATGSRVLEVNACPDFTSMSEVSEIDIAERVIETTLKAKAR